MKRHPLLLILAAALALRLVAAVGVHSYLDRVDRAFLIPGDAEGYWMLAGKIAAGEEYAVYDPPRRVLRMPGFPLLLAGVRASFGDSFLAARIVLAIVGTAACGAVYLLGSMLGSRRTGLIAAAMAACWPVLVGFSVLVLSETFFALLLTLSLVAMAWLVKRVPLATGAKRPTRQSLLAAVVVGVSVVLASYVRPTWLPAAGFFPLAYWLSSGRTGVAAMIALTIVVAAVVTLAPWTVRNRIVTGHWVPTTLWVGPSLYDGLGPTATGESDMRFFDEDQLLSRMSEFDMDRTYRARAWEFVRKNPFRTVELAFAKLWRYVRPWPGAEQFSSPAAQLAVTGFYIPMILLAVVGAWDRRRDLWFAGLAAAPFVLFALVHCVFVSSLRYRLPAEYPLCLLSAAGLQAMFGSRFESPIPLHHDVSPLPGERGRG
ncbi:MAG: glycosyltransferase family 39 protein [Planctomycetota bacterium]|nr:glycosyltransferase family 39 protein [Planctomycetota bacterium]